MRQNIVFAILLIVFGIAAFSYQGISYKTRGKAVGLNSLQVTTERIKNIPISPIVGVIALIGGLVLLGRNTERI